MPYKDKEKIKKNMKKWYLKNRKTQLAKCKQWYKDNPEYRKNYEQSLKGKFKAYKSNAKVKGLILGITFDEFVKILKKPCHYCGEKGYGIDRIDSSIGYLKDNIVSCCSMCNYMKRAYSEGEFISQCAKIYTHWNEREVI